MRLRTLRASDGSSLPALSFDTGSVQSVPVAADIEASVTLDAGVYYLISRDSDFEFTHGTGDLSGNVRIPWFKDVYLELVLVEAADVAIGMPSGVSGSVTVVPAREYSR
jgi:hypothetical protein